MKKTFAIFIALIFFSIPASAEWAGPEEVVSGTWGSGSNQFGLEQGDTIAYDRYPEIEGVLGDSSMVISDGANMRTVVYSSAGILKDSDPWTEVIKPDGRKSYSHKKYLLGCCFAGYGGTGNLWIDRKGAYMSFDNRGNPFQSASTRPLELGVTSFRYIAGVTAENRCRSVHYYEYAVEYPDAVYIFDECQEDFKSDLSGPVRVFDNLIMDNHQGSIYVYRVMRTFPALEGRKQKRYLEWIATWRKPEDEFGPPRMVCLERLANLTAEYGDPVIGPDGSVYSWKRTPTNYKILKWTWKN